MNNGTILTGNDLSKKYGDLAVVKEGLPLDCRRGIRLPGRQIGLRQDHAPLHSFRAGAPDWGKGHA